MDVRYDRRQFAAARALVSLPIRAALLVMICAFGACASEADDRPASAVVEKLQATLLDAMKNAKSLGTQGRYQKLAPVVAEVHDFSYIVRAMLGQSAGQLTPEQLKQAVDAFGDMSAQIYAHEFNDYDGERFVTLEEKQDARGMRMVRTVMQSPGTADTHFDYLLRQSGGRWRIVNTIAEGVSQLALDRSQAQSALKQAGFDGLMAWIRGRVPTE
jgi:phospholipid transport system substrate-binding protein